MNKIEFKDLPDTSTPYNAETFNALQNNIENAINEVVESGSNANGNYIKFSNGFMICSRKFLQNVSNTNLWNNFYIGEVQNIEFAQPFTTLYSCNIDIFSTRNLWKLSGNFPSLTGTGAFYTISPESITGDVEFYLIATGSWK